jgi:hypothetical protein
MPVAWKISSACGLMVATHVPLVLGMRVLFSRDGTRTHLNILYNQWLENMTTMRNFEVLSHKLKKKDRQKYVLSSYEKN